MIDRKLNSRNRLTLLKCLMLKALLSGGLLLIFCQVSGADQTESKFEVDDSSFKCITEMTQVRHFYVDNLLGNLDETIAVAQAGSGTYPEGSVLQLIPNEVMIKRQKGFNVATKDWEFFFLDVSSEGSKIVTRGFAEVNNGLGLNCFACHIKAKPEFDFVCEQEHGCDPIPITRAMFGALQRTDPRCANADPVSAEDQEALKQLDAAIKALMADKN